VLYFYEQSYLSVFPNQTSGFNIEDFISSSVAGYIAKFNEVKFNLQPKSDQISLETISYGKEIYDSQNIINFIASTFTDF